jgi:hypothetical protein
MNLSQYLIDAIANDIRIIQHLVPKLPQDSLDWRPQENMRSVRELLHYLSYIGSVVTDTFVNSTEHKADMARLRSMATPADSFDAANLEQILEDEKKKIEFLLSPLSDEELRTRTCYMPWGEQMNLFAGLLNGPVKYLAAYRMQFFIYLKQLGVQVITPNNWMGVDARPAAPKPEEQPA